MEQRNKIKCSYNTGNISGNTYIGGIVGNTSSAYESKNKFIYNSYNKGEITATGNYAGGIAGYVRRSSYIL